MQDFQYAAPSTLREAVALLAEWGDRAKILAGGTDILVQLRERMRFAEMVVDVKHIPELADVEFSEQSGLRIGAGAPCYKIYESGEISDAYGALADAAKIIGGWQIQTRASIGGNLCNSSPAADSIPPLIVHQGAAHITGPQGDRTALVEQFCTGPGKNILRAGELLTAITLPPPAPYSGSAYLRFIPRNEMDIAVAGAAAWVQLDAEGKKVESARIALSAVAPTPVLAADAGALLAGKPATAESFAQAGEAAKKAAKPISDMRGTDEYRVNLAAVLTRRALAIAAQRARSS